MWSLASKAPPRCCGSKQCVASAAPTSSSLLCVVLQHRLAHCMGLLMMYAQANCMCRVAEAELFGETHIRVEDLGQLQQGVGGGHKAGAAAFEATMPATGTPNPVMLCPQHDVTRCDTETRSTTASDFTSCR